MIKLGSNVKDKVTGFQGVAIGRTEWMNGCATIGVRPAKLDKDGKLRDVVWIDEPQLDVYPAFRVKMNHLKSRGGPIPSTPTRNQAGQ